MTFDWISCHCNSADLITGSGYSVVVGKGSSIALANCQFFKGKVTHSSNGKVWMRKNATQIRDFNKNVLIHNFKTISCLVSLFHLLRFPYDQSDPDLIQQLVAIGIWGDGQNKIMVKLMLTLWRRVFKCSLQIRLYFVPTQTLLFTNVMDSSASSARSLLFLDKTDMVLLREYPYPGLLNEPPLDSLDLQSPNSPLASLWIGSGRQTWKSYFHYTISNSC